VGSAVRHHIDRAERKPINPMSLAKQTSRFDCAEAALCQEKSFDAQTGQGICGCARERRRTDPKGAILGS